METAIEYTEHTDGFLKSAKVKDLIKEIREERNHLRHARGKERIEARDRLALIRSTLRHVRYFRKGFDVEIGSVLDFVNKDLLPGSQLRDAQELIGTCIRDLIRYGRQLDRIERKNRLRQAGRTQPPLTYEELTQVSEVAKLNASFDNSNFQRAWDTVRNSRFSFGSVTIGPPVFFDCAVRLSSTVAAQVFDFLKICSRVDPRLWARCAYCKEFFLMIRTRRSTRFCSNQCRYDDRNAKRRPRSRKRSGSGLQKRGKHERS